MVHAEPTPSSAPVQRLRSPEQVLLELPLAGPTSRMLAYAIDLCAIGLLQLAIFLGLVLSTPLADWLAERLKAAGDSLIDAQQTGQVDEAATVFWMLGLLFLIQLAFEWGYFAAVELATGGRSLGKAMLRLRVVRDGGLPIGAREALLRTLLRAVDMLPSSYVVGLVAMVLSPEHRRLGDLVAGTVVIRLDRPEAALGVDELVGADAGGFRFDRAQVGRLGPHELALLRETLRRVPSLPPARAREALQRAADVLCRKLELEPVAPPEQLAFLHALLAGLRTR